jgi:hypothetical protein
MKQSFKPKISIYSIYVPCFHASFENKILLGEGFAIHCKSGSFFGPSN